MAGLVQAMVYSFCDTLAVTADQASCTQNEQAAHVYDTCDQQVANKGHKRVSLCRNKLLSCTRQASCSKEPKALWCILCTLLIACAILTCPFHLAYGIPDCCLCHHITERVPQCLPLGCPCHASVWSETLKSEAATSARQACDSTACILFARTGNAAILSPFCDCPEPAYASYTPTQHPRQCKTMPCLLLLVL